MGSREMPLTINAPMAVTSVTDRNSMPYAKVPDAAITGLRRGIPHKSVARRPELIRPEQDSSIANTDKASRPLEAV